MAAAVSMEAQFSAAQPIASLIHILTRSNQILPRILSSGARSRSQSPITEVAGTKDTRAPQGMRFGGCDDKLSAVNALANRKQLATTRP